MVLKRYSEVFCCRTGKAKWEIYINPFPSFDVRILYCSLTELCIYLLVFNFFFPVLIVGKRASLRVSLPRIFTQDYSRPDRIGGTGVL